MNKRAIVTVFAGIASCFILGAGVAHAETEIDDGTKLRQKLEQMSPENRIEIIVKEASRTSLAGHRAYGSTYEQAQERKMETLCNYTPTDHWLKEILCRRAKTLPRLNALAQETDELEAEHGKGMAREIMLMRARTTEEVAAICRSDLFRTCKNRFAELILQEMTNPRDVYHLEYLRKNVGVIDEDIYGPDYADMLRAQIDRRIRQMIGGLLMQADGHTEAWLVCTAEFLSKSPACEKVRTEVRRKQARESGDIHMLASICSKNKHSLECNKLSTIINDALAHPSTLSVKELRGLCLSSNYQLDPFIHEQTCTALNRRLYEKILATQSTEDFFDLAIKVSSDGDGTYISLIENLKENKRAEVVERLRSAKEIYNFLYSNTKRFTQIRIRARERLEEAILNEAPFANYELIRKFCNWAPDDTEAERVACLRQKELEKQNE